MKKIIVINAIAARTSGALTILKDLINFIENEYKNKDLIFYLITCKKSFQSKENFKILVLEQMNWWERILWDSGGLKNYCKKNHIIPDLIISMQNTCTKYENIPQLVYYHQSLPLIPYKWNLLKNDERKMFLYAHFYKFFINRFNQNATYVVQLPYIKAKLLEKFPKINENKVFVIRPNAPSVNINQYEQRDHIYRFIYPANSVAYKNHVCIIKAVKELKEKNRIDECFEIIFTISSEDKISKLIRKLNLENIIKCVGIIPYEELLVLYRNSDALLFPSKIETYGMPLIEASQFGIRILASDLDFAKEVLCDYNNKVFINPDDYCSWGEEILRTILSGHNNKVISQNKINNSWKDFLEIAEKLVFNR